MADEYASVVRGAYLSGISVREIARELRTSRRKIRDLLGPDLYRERSLTSESRNCGKRRSETSNWRGNEAGVAALHARVYAERGKASEHDCVKCLELGIEKKAHDWALIHGENGFDPWSDYVALCRRHHQQYDGRPKPKSRRKLYVPEVPLDRNDEVVIYFARGHTQQSVALHFGISQSRVSQIISGYREGGRREPAKPKDTE